MEEPSLKKSVPGIQANEENILAHVFPGHCGVSSFASSHGLCVLFYYQEQQKQEAWSKPSESVASTSFSLSHFLLRCFVTVIKSH